MSMNDPLASALSRIMNCEKIGKKEVEVKPISKMIKRVLDIMNENNYIGTYKEVEDGKGNLVIVNLLGRINDCKVIKPRYSVTMDTYEKFEKRFLPAQGFGILIVSTPKGIMIHTQAKEKLSGGRLIAYCY